MPHDVAGFQLLMYALPLEGGAISLTQLICSLNLTWTDFLFELSMWTLHIATFSQKELYDGAIYSYHRLYKKNLRVFCKFNE